MNIKLKDLLIESENGSNQKRWDLILSHLAKKHPQFVSLVDDDERNVDAVAESTLLGLVRIARKMKDSVLDGAVKKLYYDTYGQQTKDLKLREEAK